MSDLWNSYKTWAKNHSRIIVNVWYYILFLTAIILGIYLLMTWDVNVGLWINFINDVL